MPASVCDWAKTGLKTAENQGWAENEFGAIAQLGERLPCTQEVCGSIPHSSTIFLDND